MTTKLKWYDGAECELPHPPSWIEWLIKNSTLHVHGYTAYPLPDKPYHLASIPPDEVKRLAMAELIGMRDAGAGI